MKILAVTNMYPTSSHPAAGTFVEQQVQGLRGLGQTVDVLLLDRQAHGPRVYWDAARRVRERVAAGRHDVLHVMYGGIMAFVATRACPDIPTVVTFHGSDLVGEKLSPIRRLSAAMGVVASNQAARRADGIVAVWSYLRDILPADIDRSKVRIIPNGIDLERFAPSDPLACRQALGWTGDAVHVLFVTNGSPQKRPELARKAVERLRERGVAAELHELQGVPYDRIPRWINASDVLLVTSEHEASPTIVKECLACNVPVVSVDVGDVRERIEGIDGCLIADADANELAAGMHAVCSAFPRVDGRTHMQSLSFMSTSSRLYDFYCDVVEAHQSVPVHGMRSS